jgi:hypothetical protein
MDVAKKIKNPISFKVCHPHVLLTVQKLNQCLSKHNYSLFTVYNYMLQRTSGHPLVQNWFLEHTEEEIYIM